nr:hypothetical protein [Nocardia abscessus]
MPKLLDPDGCFKFCSVRIGHKDLLQPLPVDEAPAELFSTLTCPVAAPAATEGRNRQEFWPPRSPWNQNLSVRI